MLSKRCFLMLLGAALLGALGACNLADALRPGKAARVYMLELAHKKAQDTDKKPKLKIAVSAPLAWPGFGTVEIAYVRSANRIEYYSKSQWVDTPAHMIGPLLVRALEDSGLFAAVIAPSAGLAADLRLDAEIVKIQHDFLSKPSLGHVILRVQWIDLSKAQVAATRTFESSVPAPSDDPAGAVIAMNQALSQIVDQIIDHCRDIVADSQTDHGTRAAPEHESIFHDRFPSPRPSVAGRSCPASFGRASRDQIRSRHICPKGRGRLRNRYAMLSW